MKKIFFLLTFSIFVAGFVKGQLRNKFTLVVKLDSPICPVLGIGEAYYFELSAYKAAIINNDTAVCYNGQYVFTGELIYTTAIRINSLKGGIKFTELFFIDTGYQEIELTYIEEELRVRKRPATAVEQEYQTILGHLGVKDINDFISPQSLLSFVQQNPSSFVALFALLDQTFAHDFKFFYKAIASFFASNIKSTKAFKYYYNEYLSDKRLPTVRLKTWEGKSIRMSFSRVDRKYTLVIFWYAACKPCVSAMFELKKEFSDLSAYINIIGISTDKKARVPDGKALLKIVNPPWKNYWDYDAEEFTKHTNIYVYPSNILIDQKGRIVAKNIELAELKKLLQTIN